MVSMAMLQVSSKQRSLAPRPDAGIPACSTTSPPSSRQAARPPQAWLEYGWLRLRRMDYWNPAHIPTNAPAKLFRANSPGAMSGAVNVKKHDDAVGTSNFSVRYFHRDQRRRDTGYYPDTPLSLNHALMKEPHSQGLRPAAETPAKLVQPPAFPPGEYGTPAAMGIKSKNRDDMGIPL